MTCWPGKLWIVRHGQSAGNVARDAAQADARDRIPLTARDVDVPLSDLGRDQSRALGGWFARMSVEERPTVVLASPYARALDTASLIRSAGGLERIDLPICGDERLREKEFGALDGLTLSGVANVFPDQAEFRRVLGKFYHRPPGGESWCDVILRLRSLLDTVSLHHADDRVLIVAHQVVVLCLRYIIETLDEKAILAIDAQGDVANCGVTEYRYDKTAGRSGNLLLERYNYVVPVSDQAVPVTRSADAIVGARG